MNNKLSALQVDELTSDCPSYIDAAIRSVRSNSVPNLDLLMYSRAAIKAIQSSGDDTLNYLEVYQDTIENHKPVTSLQLIH